MLQHSFAAHTKPSQVLWGIGLLGLEDFRFNSSCLYCLYPRFVVKQDASKLDILGFLSRNLIRHDYVNQYVTLARYGLLSSRKSLTYCLALSIAASSVP